MDVSDGSSSPSPASTDARWPGSSTAARRRARMVPGTSDGSRRFQASDRCVVDARGADSWIARRRIRRARGVDRAVARGARSHGFRARRARRGALDSREARLVHNERRTGDSVMRTNWTGVGTALVTPFTKAGELDEATVRRLARRQIDAGVHFLVPCGTTGESPTLTRRERLRTIEIIADESRGRVPVLAGAGGYDTKEVIESAADMTKAGAQGLLSVTPYYNKPSQEGL